MSYKKCKLGEVCIVRRGTTITQKQAVDGDIPVVAGGLKPTYFHNVANRHSSTITVSGSGANAGFVNFWKQPIFASDCSTVEVKDSSIDILYVYYFLLSHQDYIYRKLRSGAAQPHVYGKDIAQLDIQIPPLPIQKNIVAKLDAIFAEIEKASAATEANSKNVEALYKSFLIEFFTRKIVDSKIFNLSDLCVTLHQGLNTAGEKVKFYESGFPIIQTRNIDNGIIDITEKLKFMSTEDWLKYKDKFKPELGDVFFTNIGTIGKTAIVENTEDYLIHWNIFKIRPNLNLITSKFMKLALDYLTLSGYFSDRQKGGTVEFVTKKMISDVSLPIPPIACQIELTNKNDNFFEFCESLKESYLNKLNEVQLLKVSILKKSFNSELVKE